jgi:threonine synthase
MFQAQLQCIETACQSVFPLQSRLYTCSRCGGLLDVIYDAGTVDAAPLIDLWEKRRAGVEPWDLSGVWRYREFLPPVDVSGIVTLVEGNTQLLTAPRCADYSGAVRLTIKHLGFNPTGSFKDLGMTTGITQALALGARSVACASTGNTSASMAAYAARAGLKAFVFVPSGQIALGKLAQALDYGATVLQIDGNFDAAMSVVRDVTRDSDLYLLNSVNPFRLEGQKTIAFELLQQRRWGVPDRIVVPGGNLGNSSAIAKGLWELHQARVIDRLPKLTIVQAAGANPLYRMWTSGAEKLEPLTDARTLASAIRIGSPVSWPKAIRGLRWTNGDVEVVDEQEIADAKAIIGTDGIGCEPASAVTLAGIKKMVEAGKIDSGEDVVAILTGHSLKDPDYTVNYHAGRLQLEREREPPVRILPRFVNQLIQVPADRGAILDVLARR